MNRQRGQLMIYGALAAGAVILVMGIALKVQGSRLEAVRNEYEAFKAQVRANGEAAERAAKAKEASDKAIKEKIDNETSQLRTTAANLARQLRDSRSASGYLPPASATSASPDAITFDRAKLERTIQQLDEGVSGLIARGDQAVIDLNLSLKWAQAIKP